MLAHSSLSSLNPANSSTVQLRNNLKNADFWAQTNASIKRFLTFFVKVCIDEVPELKSYSTATTLSEFDKWRETRAGSGTGLCPLALARLYTWIFWKHELPYFWFVHPSRSYIFLSTNIYKYLQYLQHLQIPTNLCVLQLAVGGVGKQKLMV